MPMRKIRDVPTQDAINGVIELMSKKQKLELTWVGKDERLKLEPRVLVEDPEKSYGDPKSENMLIYGDNLLSLKALEQDFTGKIKCVYIDPPYNTGNAFAHYDDGLEHSMWLNLMYPRIQILHKLLAEDGVLFVNLDENEHAYMKVMIDSIFLRQNFLGDLIWRKRKGGGNDSRYFALDHDYILVYAKTNSKEIHSKKWRVSQSDKYLKRYKEIDENGNRYYWDTLARDGLQNPIPVNISCPDGSILSINSQKSEQTITEGLKTGSIRLTKIKNNWSLHHRVYMPEGQVLRSILDDVGTNKSAKDEMEYLFNDKKAFDYPKPETLIKKILELCTKEGDWVLDSFAGSGTTGAVAHKMGRKWIMCELGEHCHTHIIPRMQRVIDGTDQGGISKTVNWKGGGGFKYYRLAESLLVKDKDLSTENQPVYVINPRYDEVLLIKSICKIENFRYRNDGRLHGISSENRFLHVTTRILTQAYLESLAEDINKDQSLLIYCTRKSKNLRLPDNVEIKKIPKNLLEKCDFEEDKR
jgi:adenine-specific DNA-methyltransferase